MEYEERESEFDIEDEDKSEPEQTGNIHTYRLQTQGACGCSHLSSFDFGCKIVFKQGGVWGL